MLNIQIEEIMIRIPIICCNGIGDSLLLLSRMPISLLGRLGFRFRILYISDGHPAARILIPIFREIKYCEYSERKPTSLESKVFTKLLSLFGRIPFLFAVPLGGDGSARYECAPQERKRILLHTHLDGHHGWKGAVAKIWALENWIELCRSLDKLQFEVFILEWDSSSFDALTSACPYLKDGRKGSDVETMRSFEFYDCLFSVDSWSKYVAAWYRIPQVVVVPDLRTGYCGFEEISPDEFARWWFHGIIHHKGVIVIGLEKAGDTYSYTLPSMNDLEVNVALEKILDVLR